MPEAVVHLPLLRIAQNRIGLGANLELLLGLGVVGVAIRVKLEGLVAVGLLELGHGDFAGDFENFVIIRLRHEVRGPFGRCNISMLARRSRSAVPRQLQCLRSDLGFHLIGGAAKDVADERVGELARALESPHVQDGLASQICCGSTSDLLNVFARLEGNQARSWLDVDALEQAEQRLEGVHFHVRAGRAAACRGATLATRNPRHDPEAALHILRDGLAGNGKYDLRGEIRSTLGDVVPKLGLHLPNDRSDHARFGAEDESQVGLLSACDRVIDLTQDERENVRRGADDAVAFSLRLQGELEHFAGDLQVRAR